MEKSSPQQLLEQYQVHTGDTGSSRVQVGLLTERIRALTGHLRAHRRDYAALRGLMMMVGRRRRLLRYLSRREPEAYQALLQKLELRK